MKIKESYLQEMLKADRRETSDRTNGARRQPLIEQENAANKTRQNDSSIKDEMKFAGILQSAAKPQKNERQRDDSGDERRDDEKKDKERNTQKKDAAENLTNDGRMEKYPSSNGNQSGGQGGFNFGGNVGSLNLSEAFAARSILHIADLERMISVIKTQTELGGRREIILQLKRSVMEGLQIKIAIDATAKVQVEFLAADEKSRSQIEKHSTELAGILRGRGINLETLKTSLAADAQTGEQSSEKQMKIATANDFAALSEDSTIDNTFINSSDADDRFYQA